MNDAPTAVVLSNTVTSTAERGGAIKVAGIAITDDALGTNGLALSGADAGSFSILNGNELWFTGGADYEAKKAYDVTVTVNDPAVGGTPDASQSFHLAITNLNEVLGGPGNDYLWGSVGDDDIDGGAGIDTALFAGLRWQYGISGASFDATGASVQVTGPEGYDFIYGIESLQFADGRMVYDLNDPMAAVYRMYDSAFGRTPDALGKNGWTSFLQQGHSITEMAKRFASSAEFSATYGSLSNQQFVEQLYHNVLGRAGDAAGVSGWTASLNSGANSRGQVLAGFSESAEHIQLLSPEIRSGIWDIDETAASVARLYYAALERSPDANGLVGWKNAIDNGMSLSTAADGFAASAEFQQKYGTLTNQQFVEQLYHNVLDRDGDAAGVSGWTNYLNSGAGDRGDVLLGFSNSFEHQARDAQRRRQRNPFRMIPVA